MAADGEGLTGRRGCGRGTEFDNIIVVDNVPRVSQEKEEKLKIVLRKTFKPCGEIRENGIHMPRDPDPANPSGTMTRGYVRTSLLPSPTPSRTHTVGEGLVRHVGVYVCM